MVVFWCGHGSGCRLFGLADGVECPKTFEAVTGDLEGLLAAGPHRILEFLEDLRSQFLKVIEAARKNIDGEAVRHEDHQAVPEGLTELREKLRTQNDAG